MIDKFILPRRETNVSLMFINIMNSLLAEGRINSYYRYRSALKAFEDFASGPLMTRDITPEWLHECERTWRNNGKSRTSINIYMKAMKCILAQCVREGCMNASKFPFGSGGYRIPQPCTRNMAITKEEIFRVAAFRGSRSLEKYRDLWLFSYLCNGINFRDMLFLRYSNIQGEEICFVRSKTSRSGGRMVRAPITEEMHRILQKWGNPPYSADTFLFKYARKGMTPMEETLLVRKVTGLCNNAMHRIAEELGIDRVSTYSARHTFATVLLKEGVDIRYISEALGHSSISMTETYLAGANVDERKIISSYLLHK